MAVGDNPKGFRPANPNARVGLYQEAASQSFATGDLVYLNSGKVQIALAATAELCGVAAEPATGTTNALIKVYNDPAELFIGRTDAADALAIGGPADAIGATGAMQIDANGGATAVFINVEELDYDQADAIGKEYKVRIVKHAFADLSS